jgi:hypothetical protein
LRHAKRSGLVSSLPRTAAADRDVIDLKRFSGCATKVCDRAVEVGLRLKLAPARRNHPGLSFEHKKDCRESPRSLRCSLSNCCSADERAEATARKKTNHLSHRDTSPSWN